MRIILPNETENLGEFEKKLNANTLSALMTSNVAMERKVHLHLPRFRMSYQVEVSKKTIDSHLDFDLIFFFVIE